MNYGNLLLQALLEHWWRPLHADDENEGNGNDGNGPLQHTRGGNPYFSVPSHTPVIFRYAKSVVQEATFRWLYYDILFCFSVKWEVEPSTDYWFEMPLEKLRVSY